MPAQSAPSQTPPPGAPPAASAFAPWLAWTWVLLLALAAVATLGGLDDLRLALDVQRHFAPSR